MPFFGVFVMSWPSEIARVLAALFLLDGGGCFLGNSDGDSSEFDMIRWCFKHRG